MDENQKRLVREMIQAELRGYSGFQNRKLGDTPTDAFQLVNKKYTSSFVSSFVTAYVDSSVAAGSDTEVIFNDGGVLGGDSAFTWNKTSNKIIFNENVVIDTGGTSPSKNLQIQTGGVTGGAVSGALTITTGGVVSGTSGGLTLKVGQATSGTAGDIAITGETSGGTGATGSQITITAGSGGSSTSPGGPIFLTAGDGGNAAVGGSVNLTAGRSSSGSGAAVTITGGEGAAGTGGTVNVVGGGSSASFGTGGPVAIQAGSAGGSGQGGEVTINASSAHSAGSLPGGAVTIKAGNGGNSSGKGGEVSILSGSAGGGNNNGGDISIKPGLGAGTGHIGDVKINAASVLSSSVAGGFLVIPMCTGVPTGTPASNGSLIYDISNNKLYVYNSGWVSATFA